MAKIPENDTNRLFQQLNERNNRMYQFVLVYNDYINMQHNYGTEYEVTMTEAHTITYIEENPGTTITDLALYWSKTKSALSQTVTKLEKRGLVERRKSEENAKTVLLYVTDEGLMLSKAHKLYDLEMTARNMGDLSASCTQEEIDAFFKVIGNFAEIMEQEIEDVKASKRSK